MSQSDPDMMHSLVAYQWLATYVVQLPLPYLGHQWQSATYRGFSKFSSLAIFMGKLTFKFFPHHPLHKTHIQCVGRYYYTVTFIK